MAYIPPGSSGDPFGSTTRTAVLKCQVCSGRVDASDAFCRTCGEPPGTGTSNALHSMAAMSNTTAEITSRGVSSFRAQGSMLAVAALLIGAGLKFPWIAIDGMPSMQFGFTPPLNEIWPVAAGAALLGLLGLSVAANAERVTGGTWLLSLFVTVGVIAAMFPKYRETTQAIIDADGMGISHGLGLWLIAGGIIAALIASASGWSAASRQRP